MPHMHMCNYISQQHVGHATGHAADTFCLRQVFSVTNYIVYAAGRGMAAWAGHNCHAIAVQEL